MLTFRKFDPFKVMGCTNSGYASYVDDCKSTSSYIFMMFRGTTSWKSIKQTLIATSMMEAEYIVCYETTC